MTLLSHFRQAVRGVGTAVTPITDSTKGLLHLERPHPERGVAHGDAVRTLVAAFQRSIAMRWADGGCVPVLPYGEQPALLAPGCPRGE